jgi:hypothetical protein
MRFVLPMHMPSSWPMVITPVPPMPATTMPHARVASGSSGSGNVGKPCSAAFACGFSFFFGVPPSTVTKLGQKPFTQEKSLLQLFWLMVRLRP